MKFLVLKGRGNPGNIDCKYSIFDVLEVGKTEVESQLRKYSFRKFYEMGASAKTMREEVYTTKKAVFMNNSVPFCDPVTVYHHTHTYLMFVPMKEVCKWAK